MIGIADDALGTYFLAAKYFYVLLFALWVALVYRFRQAWILVGGTVLACVYAYLVVQAPLGRPYALYPGTDRTFNVAMVATAATGHSAFESYQVGFGDHEPLWRWSMSVVSLRDPANVVLVYSFLTPVVMLLLALSLYFGLRAGDRASASRWELALVVYCVLLLSSAPNERFGVFESFWPMTLLLKPNHVLGFVLIPWWMRAFTRRRTLVAALVLALLSWVFLLHWAYLGVGLALYPVTAKLLGRAPEWKRAWLVAAVSLAAAVPYIIFLFDNFPPTQTTVGLQIWESTYAFREGYWNVFAVGYEHGLVFILSLAGLWVMLRRKSEIDVLWLSVVAGLAVIWLAYLLGFALRKTVEPEEFYFFARFVLAVASGTGAYFVIEQAGKLVSKPITVVPRGVCLFLLLTLPLSFPYWWNPVTMGRYFDRSRPPIPDEVIHFAAWARDATDPDAVFVSGPRTASWIAALSGRRVLLTGSLRPPNDYERRRDLTERLLERPDQDGFEAAHDEYHVTHVALDSDLMEEFDVDRATVASLPWLTKVYGNDELSVYELDLH